MNNDRTRTDRSKTPFSPDLLGVDPRLCAVLTPPRGYLQKRATRENAQILGVALHMVASPREPLFVPRFFRPLPIAEPGPISFEILIQSRWGFFQQAKWVLLLRRRVLPLGGSCKLRARPRGRKGEEFPRWFNWSATATYGQNRVNTSQLGAAMGGGGRGGWGGGGGGGLGRRALAVSVELN